MTKINKDEYEILKSLDSKWKWLARDHPTDLFAYRDNPEKYELSQTWDDREDYEFINSDLFSFIQWENKEPYNIQELIEGYEKSSLESEETEVKKDKEWLLDTFRSRQAFNNNFSKGYVLEKVKQLDEPETLSHEWIRENQERMGDHFYVKVNKLQNLLTPKPEKVKVPQVVAGWLDDNIERYETFYSFIVSIVEVFGNPIPEKVQDYARKNPDTMARAYLDGYEAEEQKFYLIFPNIDNQGYKYTFIDTDGGFDAVDCKEHIIDLGKTFTEQEIEELDPNYMHFAIKVEEVE